MRVLVTGGTGLVGRALIQRLLIDNHQVIAWARSPQTARRRLGSDVEVVDHSDGFSQALKGVEGVVNLAGEPVMKGRWTPRRREELRQSRVALTEALCDAMVASQTPPQVLVSASAAGYYGNAADRELPETASPGSGFLAELCQAWEAATTPAKDAGIRTVRLRIAVIVSGQGGALASMAPAFRLGIGGPIGSGRQFMPWIHLDDLVEVIVGAVTDRRYEGPINAVAPEAVTNKQFAATLGKVLGRPAAVRAPQLAMRMALGTRAEMLTEGQRMIPEALAALGFEFRFPTLSAALTEALGA